MEKIKSILGSKIKIITSHPIFGVFLLVVIIFYGVISAETTNIGVIPLPPSDLSLEGTTPTTISLSWDDNSNNENKFNIERKLSNATSWSTLTQITNSNTTSYTDTTVTTGVYYDYRVQACLSGTGCSEYSTPLERVSALMANNSEDGIDVSSPINFSTPTTLSSTMTAIPLVWAYNADNSTASQFVIIEKKLSSAIPYLPIYTSSINTIYYSDTAVTKGTSYDYRIKACISTAICSNYIYLTNVYIPNTSENNNSGDSSRTTVIPLPPSDLSLEGTTPTTISLSWDDNSNNENKFNIERKLSNATSWSTLTQITNSNTTSYTDTTVTTGVYYDYRVQACLSGTGCSSYAILNGVNSLSYVVKDMKDNNDIIPLPPTNLSLDSITIPTYVSLKWTDNSNNEDKFNIERKLSTSTVWLPLSRVGINAVHYVDTTVYLDMAYDYRVQACLSEVGCSTYSYLYKIVTTHTDPVVSPPTIPPATDPIIPNPIIQKPTPEIPHVSPLDPKVISNEIKNNTIQPPIEIDEKDNTIQPPTEIKIEDIAQIINTISSGNNIQNNQPEKTEEKIEDKTIDLIYKDTNSDGVSDYDSVHVYNMDPEKPSPVSIYEGKEINAAEKILLDFDPAQSELVKVEKEEPIESVAPTTVYYTVEEVKLTEQKEIVIKGQGLPNSFITIYIYSTPIIVTIRTDNNGEWQYILDRELEDGNHTVYAATVNNTGNIVAKSSGYIFTKTAEAVTLNDLPIVEASNLTEKPTGLLENINIYLVISVSLALIITVLILAGAISKRTNLN